MQYLPDTWNFDYGRLLSRKATASGAFRNASAACSSSHLGHVLWIASGQTYTISTFAGGGLPVNIPGTSASLGLEYGLAVDSAGNAFIAIQDQDTVLRLDGKTGLVSDSLR